MTDDCSQALGMENHKIRNSQIFGGSVYKGDYANYGSQNARLHNRVGYRADPKVDTRSNMIGINLEEDMVITAIATQGYGDSAVSEWVTSFNVLYKNSDGKRQPIKSTDGKQKVRLKRRSSEYWQRVVITNRG